MIVKILFKKKIYISLWNLFSKPVDTVSKLNTDITFVNLKKLKYLFFKNSPKSSLFNNVGKL